MFIHAAIFGLASCRVKGAFMENSWIGLQTSKPDDERMNMSGESRENSPARRSIPIMTAITETAMTAICHNGFAPAKVIHVNE